MEIYDESGAKDAINFPDVTMTEIGSSGRYKGSFTPDAEGKWRIMIDSATTPGKVVKDFGVGGYDVDAVGIAVLAEADAIRGADSDTLKTISDQIDNLPQIVPPMIG